jgi:MFS transporter, DHA1 family, tetracycline resistance protein
LPPRSSTRRTLAILLFTVFIDIMGFGIMLPIIPILLADPRSPFFLLPPGMTLGQGYILLGSLAATFSFMQFLTAPILGQLSDRYGRKKILAISRVGTSVSYFLFAVGIILKNLPLLFFARALDGATGGVIAVAQASIADLTEPQKRVRRFALLSAAFGLGFIGGPFLGGKLSDPSLVPWFNATTPFWFAGFLSLANALFVSLFLPETLAAPGLVGPIRWNQSWQNVVRAFSHPALRILFLTSFLYQTGFSFYASFASVFMINRFGFNQGNIGDYFAFLGGVGLLTQLFIVRRLAHRWAPPQILRLTLWLAGAFMFLASFASLWWTFMGVMLFFAVCSNLNQTNSTGLISASVGGAVQGEVMGLASSIAALAMGLTPLASGFLAAGVSPEAPIRVAALLIFLAAAAFRWLYRPPAGQPS